MTTKRTLAIRPDPGGVVPETAMVMAAGLGKRMRPLTATRPKPLVEVAGKPLIDHVFNRLRAAGVKRAVVNVHYLADALEAHLTNRVKGIEIAVSDERGRLMETGGGIVQARELIGDKPFLVVNSDNLWIDGPADAIRLLGARWDDATMDALLLMVPLAKAHNHGGQGDFHLAADGRITKRRQPRTAGAIRLYRRADPVAAGDRRLAGRRLLDDAVLGNGRLPLAGPMGWSIRACGSTSARPAPSGRPRRSSPMADAVKPQLFTIPAHRAFADALATGLIRRFGGEPLGLARGLVLLPNNRAKRALTDAFVRASEGGLVLPRLVSIGELDEATGAALDPADDADPVPPAVPALQRRMILARLVSEERLRAGQPVDAAEAIRLAGDLARDA